MYRSLSLLVLAACYHLSRAESESTNSTLSVSSDGSCGESSSQTCLGSTYGSCCSLKGFCGSTNDFCNPTAGCQSSYGSCSTNTSYISYDGRCGSTDPNSQVCVGSTYGSCCSQKGWCGGTTDYCGIGCQSAFGTCGGDNVTVETNTETASSGTTTTLASSSKSTMSTSTSVASSSTSGASSADSTSSASPDASNQGPSLVGYQVAIGVLCAVLALLSIVIVMLILQRRAKQQPGIISEKSDGSVVEAPSIHEQSMKGSLISTFEHSRPNAVELGSAGHGRPELRENYVEIDSQKRW